jgi:cephalosporin-C deacetylase-like acetyl esterase
VNFARNIKIPVRMEVGSADTVCPPMAGFSAYNVMPSKDKEIYIGLGQGHSVFKEIVTKMDRWLVDD